MALLRRYNLAVYRYHGQKRTTVMSSVSKRFVDETLWPQFCDLNEALKLYLCQVTDRVIAESIHADSTEPTERPLAALPGMGVSVHEVG